MKWKYTFNSHYIRFTTKWKSYGFNDDVLFLLNFIHNKAVILLQIIKNIGFTVHKKLNVLTINKL